MAQIDLGDIEKELSERGFAVREGNLGAVGLASVLQRRWQQMPQKGGSSTSTLRPMGQGEAPARTLSAVYGLGSQPLHTDGAHLKAMPDVIVLYASDPTPTPTKVWKLSRRYPSALRSGVFTVRGNGSSFLAHAVADGRLRFDPVCMSPADHLAKEAQAFLIDASEAAHVHHWDIGGLLLFVDNRTALHGRDAIADGADAQTRAIERATYLTGAR